MPPSVAPLSMKIIPLRWRGAGWVVPGREGPTPRRLRPSALPRGGVSREVCDSSLAFLKRCDLYYGVLYHKKI